MATQAAGYRRELLVGFESTYGTAPAAGNYIKVPYMDYNLGSEEAMIPSTVMRGDRYTSEPSFGNVSVQGSATVPLDVRNLGIWLKALIGQPSSSGVGPYVHEYDPTVNIPSMACESGYTDIGTFHKFTGVKVSSGAFQFSVGEELKASFEIMGRREETPAGTTIDDTPDEKVIDIFQGKQIAVKKGGSTITSITNISFNVNNGLYGDNYTLGEDGFRHDLPETSFSIEGSFSMLFDDVDGVATYLEAQNNTETSLQITATNGSHTLVIDIDELKFPRRAPQASGANPVMLEQPFSVYYQDGAKGVPIRFTLTNDEASY